MTKNILFLILALPTLTVAATTQPKPLTIERIFESPELDGPRLVRLGFSPNGKHLTFLRGKKDNYEVQDLWEFDLTTGQPRLLVDSAKLKFGELSEAEKSRRERMRISRQGIVEYFFAEQGSQIVFPAGGDLYLYDFKSPVKRLTQSPSPEMDVQFSPKDTYVAFVREQNLYVFDLKSGREVAITREGKGDISYGSAEFIAQEEMARYSGYWWSKDENFLAFTEVDESPVKMVDRFEIGATGVTVRKQRYPEAGSANARVRLGIVSLGDALTGTAKPRWIALAKTDDIYLPRVEWTEDGKLVYQVQSRDQKTLELFVFDPKTAKSERLVKETHAHWVSIHDSSHWLKKSTNWIWASEKSGYQHLYLMDRRGKQLRQLTQGNFEVNLVGVDEEGGWVYYSAAPETPLQSRLFRVSLDKSTEPEVITKEEGSHWITMDKNAKFFIDYVSTATHPPRVSLRKASGESVATLQANDINASHPLYPYKDQLIAPEFGSFKAASGEDIYFSVRKPKNFDAKKKYPLIVTGYGGPGVRMVGNFWRGRMTLFENYLVQCGFVVATIDNRGSSGRGRRFEDALYRAFGTVEVEDQKAGVEHLVKQGYVDAKKVGFFGWSYGGYLALMLAAKAPDTFRANVAVAPVTDFSLYDTHYTERFMGKPKENKGAYERANVLIFVPKINSRLMIIHGMADDNVLFTNSTVLFKALQENGKLYESVTYPGSKHGIYGKANQTHLHRSIADFFERHMML